jgi:tetratricopeptide (TPR) repeat protein
MISIALFATNASIIRSEDKEISVTAEILNPEYIKPPNINDNVEINAGATVEDILKKVNYYYATHDWDKAIELCKLALEKTNDEYLIAKINFALSSNYLQKGNEAYGKNKDDSFYKLSIQFAKRSLEVIPDSWQALGNLGSVYLNMGDYKQAIFYDSEAEKYLDKNNPNYAAIEYHRSLAEKLSKGY